MSYYAVAKGKTVGIFPTWNECQEQVRGSKGAIFKKFSTQKEAEQFIAEKTGKPYPNGSLQVIQSESIFNEPCEKVASLEAASANMGNQIRTGIGRSAQLISALPMSRSGQLPSCSVAKVKLSFDLRRELHDAKQELTALKDKVPLNTDTTASFEIIDCKLTKVLDYLNNKAAEMKKSQRDEETGEDESASKKSRKDPMLIEGMSKSTDIDPDGFNVDADGFVHVYTDGACSDNGRGSLSKAGIGVWWADSHPLNLSEPVSGEKATNNAAEIQAAIRAIEVARENSITKLWIQTDSMFVINCMTKWIEGWKRKGWMTSSSKPVINKDDLVKLDNVLNCDNSLTVRWGYVTAHKGVHGNEAADELAKAGATRFNMKRKLNSISKN